MTAMPRRKALAALLALVGGIGRAAAEGNGAPLTMVVPAAAGSAPDIVARVLAQALQQRLGQSVIVENKPGAGGIVAVMAAKSMAGRGDTLLFAHAAVATVTPLTYRAAKYDLTTDFEPVSVVADTPMMFVANLEHGPKSLAEAVAQAKARPDSVVLGSTTRGSIPHLAGVLLGQLTGARFDNIPMNNSSQALQAVVSGDSALSVDGIAPLLPMVRSGRVRPLAVTANRVLPGLESLPLAKEAVPGLELNGWFMLFAGKGTPAARQQQINDAVNAALQSPEMAQKLQTTANFPVGGSIADARAFLAAEKKKWALAVERAGLQAE